MNPLLFAALLSTHSAVPDTTVVVDTNVAVPMRDGVVLRADVWRSAEGGRHPVLVFRTPYGKHLAVAAFATARRAVARGYVVVLQDVRGRYASDGEFLPYQQEGRDGYDTIEWAAAQPWSDGSVGTFGLSYPGAVQWLAAVEDPPHLKAMVPAMTFASPMHFWYFGGVWDNSWMPWIHYNIAPDRRARLGLSGPNTDVEVDSIWRRTGDSLRAVLPLSAADTYAREAPWFYEWMRHPADDPWWGWADLRDKYGRTKAAVLNVSGWHDDAYGPLGATTNFAGLVASRGDDARTSLLIGPWQHGVPRMDRTTAGERDYGRSGIVDYDAIVLDWMDRHVRGIHNGVDSEPPVRVFVMGSNKWITAGAWPIPGTRADTITLSRPGTSTTIVSDPMHPVRNEFADRPGAHDYRALAQHPDVVVFETPPLSRDLTVVGAMAAELTVSVDAPDADVWARVFDVAPDGTALNLMSPGLDVQRLSYRGGRRELLTPGALNDVRFDHLLTGNTFAQGHRIRLVIAPSFTPDFPPNLHTGLLESASATGRAARITVLHDAGHPVRLILPVVPAAAMLSAPQ